MAGRTDSGLRRAIVLTRRLLNVRGTSTVYSAVRRYLTVGTIDIGAATENDANRLKSSEPLLTYYR